MDLIFIGGLLLLGSVGLAVFLIFDLFRDIYRRDVERERRQKNHWP